MPTRLWRILALAGMLFTLCTAIADVVNPVTFATDHILTESADGTSIDRLRVIGVLGTPAENGGLKLGDIVTPQGGYPLRMREGSDPPGTTHVWIVRRGTQRPFIAKSLVTPEPFKQLVIDSVVHVVRFAMILMGLLVAYRRPDVLAARALATFLVITALTMYVGGVWLPDPLYASWIAVRGATQDYGLSQGVLFAAVFPFASTTGIRSWIRRVNVVYTLAAVAYALASEYVVRTTGHNPQWGALGSVLDWLPMGFFVLMFVAFGAAIREATSSDRVRIYWAAGSIIVGFTGPIVQTIIVFFFHNFNGFDGVLALTLVALPIGLAYTILRHRTVDIGFVISRALVLTILSFLVVAAFGLIERAIGKFFIDASHVASRSVEVALALGLGFSMRSLHSRIEVLVDRLFFRTRRRALATLKSFAEDVYFITDPDVAIERAVSVVGHCADAENTALYLIADGVFGRAAAIAEHTLPSEVDENDPLFVRMRASRRWELLRGCGSALDAEIAFPIFVRGNLVGSLILAAKRSGEAYDPEETGLIAELAQRVGLALDALQTLALRRELDLLMAAR